MSAEFLKLNPEHTIPTLVDGDYVLWESRAIAAYLVNSKAPGHSLYPTDPKVRGRIDQKLYFDLGTLQKRGRDIAVILLLIPNFIN